MLKKLLTGSTILNQHFNSFRSPKDTDYFVNEQDTSSGERGVEYLYNPIIFKFPNLFKGGEITLQGLFNVKFSHLRFNINWNKHIYDVQFMLENCPNDCVLDRDYQKEQFEFWEKYLPKVRRSKLEQDKDEFFNNAVNDDIHQHDFLHTLIAIPPAYTKLLKEGASVELDENKWHALCSEEKDDVVLEETITMSAERYRVGGDIISSAFRRQLRENIIKHFPPYIAEYSIFNHKRLNKFTNKDAENIRKILKYLNK